MAKLSKKDLLGDLGLSKEDGLKAVVSALALIHEARQGSQSPDGSSPPSVPMKEALFELAKLHTATIGRLATLNADYTGKMVDFLRQRREGQARSRPTVQLLVTLKMDAAGGPAEGTFNVTNQGKEPRTYPLPTILELNGLQDDKPGAFVEAQFSAAGALAPLLSFTVPAGETRQLALRIARSSLLGDDGRYRARVLLEAPGAPTAELIIELLVVKLVAAAVRE